VYSGKIYVHIADDGTSDEYRRELLDIAGGYKNVDGVSVSNSERGGYGKNVNLAMQTCHIRNMDIMCMVEDDWVLTRTLDIDSFLDVFQTTEFGCIRLGYLGWTQSLSCTPVIVGQNFYLHILPESAEPHVWSGHPRIETVAWQRKVGPWSEGLQPGATEFEIAHRPEARQGVLWPFEVHPRGDMFAHIGTIRSY